MIAENRKGEVILMPKHNTKKDMMPRKLKHTA
jgi:hypothetical protein